MCQGSRSPATPVTAPWGGQREGPGLSCPRPLYLLPLHSVVPPPPFMVKDFGLFCHLLQLVLAPVATPSLAVLWGGAGEVLEISDLLLGVCFRDTGQQKVPPVGSPGSRKRWPTAEANRMARGPQWDASLGT